MPTRTLRRARLRHLVAIGLALASSLPLAAFPVSAARADDDAPRADAAARAAFVPTAELDLLALEHIVLARSPAVQAAALEVDVAAAERRQARLLPNPTLDASWNTIPVGETNPPGLGSPLAHVPNYGVGLSYTFPLGKRGPRGARADELARAAAASFDASVRDEALSLARLLGEIATSMLRIDGTRELVEDGRRSVTLAEARVASSFGTPLDVDRLRIDVSRTEQSLSSIESDLRASLAACAGFVGAPCRSFADSADARVFLERWITRPMPPTIDLAARADLRSLEASRRAAAAEAELARAQAIPDPTVRLGYVHDTFLVSGAQANSLDLSVSIPLPLFDRGQAQAAAADARRARLDAQRARSIAAAEARIGVLAERVASQRRRQQTLTDDVIPRARAVLRDVEKAAESRLLPLGDVIQARRQVSELLIEQADSYRDAFDAALELAAELPSTPVVTEAAPR